MKQPLISTPVPMRCSRRFPPTLAQSHCPFVFVCCHCIRPRDLST
jgi:hypothetical protein